MAENNDKKEQKIEKLTQEELKQKQEQFLKEFMDKNTKELKVTSISTEFKKEVARIIPELEKTQKEIEEKKQSFVKQYKTVEDKLDILTKEGQIKLNDKDFQKSRDSFKRYEDSLNQVLGEIIADITFYSNLIGENPPQTIKVFKNSTDDAAIYLIAKLKVTKKNIKKITKDVRVSYSRYFVGLEEQVRKLDYLSSYLKSAKNKK